MGFPADALTKDGFLNGQLVVSQPRSGYRAATDPVFLAAAVPAKSGEAVLELGCGAGTALLCLSRRVAGLELAGVEIQPDYADLARKNAAENDVLIQVTTADLENLPRCLRDRSFDHIIANPPFFGSGQGSRAADQGRETALREVTPLTAWIDTAMKRLKPKGYLCIIHLAERLPELLAKIDGRFGGIEVKPLTSRNGQRAGRVIVRARKGARAAFQLFPPLIVHDGDVHSGDCESYTPEVKAILRDADPMHF